MYESHILSIRGAGRLAVVLAVLLLSGEGIGGTLDDFEDDATRNRDDRKFVSRGHCRESGDSFFQALFQDVFSQALAIGAECSSAFAKKREPGWPVIPNIKFDFIFQDVQSDVSALGWILEAGDGPLSGEFRQTHYRERKPDDAMDIYQAHLLCRMCASGKFETGLAFGALIISGNERNAGFSFGIPFRYWPSDGVGLEFRPLFGDISNSLVSDLEISALLRHEHVSFRLGYRWMASPGKSLDGPCVGLSFRY